MKKVIKVMIGLLAVVGLFFLLFKGCTAVLRRISSQPNVPTNYQDTVQMGGELEKKYMTKGDSEVTHYEQAVLQGFSKYTICYPSQLAEENGTYPVIVLCNGTGVPMSKYLPVAEHFASWGFIVIGTEEEYDWNGFAAEMCVRYLQLLNDNSTINDSENIFYQKIDMDNVGIVGHSQGGVGVINAITTQKDKDIFKAAVAISPTNQELAAALQWDYDASKVDTPIMLISGEGGGDDWVVTGAQLSEIYNDIPDNKIMLRRKNTAHGETLYAANGYVTAWFMWQLQEDMYAASAFTGDEPEIMRNSLYQDQLIDLN